MPLPNTPAQIRRAVEGAGPYGAGCIPSFRCGGWRAIRESPLRFARLQRASSKTGDHRSPLRGAARVRRAVEGVGPCGVGCIPSFRCGGWRAIRESPLRFARSQRALSKTGDHRSPLRSAARVRRAVEGAGPCRVLRVLRSLEGTAPGRPV